MNKHIFNILFLSFFSVLSIFGEEFDLALNWGNVGWGMNISKDYNEHIFTVDLFDAYIEHEKSNIGIKFNPIQYNLKDGFSFLNFGLSYNISNILIEFTKEGSNYFFLGPYFAINYLIVNDLGDFNFTVGVRALGMIDDNPESPLGWQILNFEFGYRFNKNKNNAHNFYFNLSLDIAVVAYIIHLSALGS